jgi:hypothetical protein
MRRFRSNVITGAVAAIVVLSAVPAASAALHAVRGTPDCVRDQLGVRNNGVGGAAGTIHAAWVFTNRSASACKMNGYPDLQRYGRAGRPLLTTVQTDLPPAPTDVTLAPGGSATFFTSASDVISGSDRCPPSAVLQITAPNADASLFIPATIFACDGVVHVSAVRAGIHHP